MHTPGPAGEKVHRCTSDELERHRVWSPGVLLQNQSYDLTRSAVDAQPRLRAVDVVQRGSPRGRDTRRAEPTSHDGNFFEIAVLIGKAHVGVGISDPRVQKRDALG